MDRRGILYDADALGVGILDIHEFSHALGVIFGGAPLCDLDVAPGPVSVDAAEQIDSVVGAICAVVAFKT